MSQFSSPEIRMRSHSSHLLSSAVICCHLFAGWLEVRVCLYAGGLLQRPCAHQGLAPPEERLWLPSVQSRPKRQPKYGTQPCLSALAGHWHVMRDTCLPEPQVWRTRAGAPTASATSATPPPPLVQRYRTPLNFLPPLVQRILQSKFSLHLFDPAVKATELSLNCTTVSGSFKTIHVIQLALQHSRSWRSSLSASAEQADIM